MLILRVCSKQFYSDPTQERCSSVVVSTLTLSVAIVTLLLIPLDIYNVSRDVSQGGGSIERHGAAIQLVYYGLFLILLACVFLMVPFVLFYHEVSKRWVRAHRCYATRQLYFSIHSACLAL